LFLVQIPKNAAFILPERLSWENWAYFLNNCLIPTITGAAGPNSVDARETSDPRFLWLMAVEKENITLRFIDWLARRAAKTDTVANFFGDFNEFLNKSGYGIFRANFASRSLHPQVGAISLIWSSIDDLPLPPPGAGILSMRKLASKNGFMTEVRVTRVSTESSAFQASPMAPVTLQGRVVREKIPRKARVFKYPILKDLWELGATDYVALPIRFSGRIDGFASFASNRAGGFRASDIADIKRLTQTFSFALEAKVKDELLDSLLRIYLGEITGPEVLSGRIRRGDMESFESVIWFSDIRGFSALGSIMQPEELIELLNSYYEVLIPAIRKYGGEVLKFLGDGLLVIFSAKSGKELQVKYQSLIAANAAGKALKKLNAARVEQGKIPIGHGIGLHYGKIQYGNIGSDDRMDFTAVGAAVNIASRVAAQCAELGESLLISEDLARFLRIRLKSHGQMELKGIPKPVEIFSLPGSARHENPQ
jgi:adenylate cyclase